ncbi:deoxyribose-phosphate aldolase [Terrabacter carboxydivorans]|uniref:Deoxyribose-phosphate aldolase n=2 Tax=Terrabacter carboxydivorans TaxID=619730 RepID=A0ABP5ZVA6_9MICO
MLDHRLHMPRVGPAELKAGCQLARDHRLAAVTCRPEHVAMAAEELAGTDVAVVTAIGSQGQGLPASDDVWVEEARELTAHGATELAVVVTAALLELPAWSSLVRTIETLAALQSEQGFRLRVHLDTAGLADEQITAACRALRAAGVWMVQGGLWQGERTGFRQVVLMREALGPDVLLKWTTPVSSLPMLLLAKGEGVDRFNANVTELLRDASRQARLAPLLVPLQGLDY